jgi:release factor glutamine methyltransferase
LTLRELLASIPKRRRADAEWLMMSSLGLTRSALLLEGARPLDRRFLRRWGRMWERRLRGEPLQYIVGSAPFFGHEFRVSSQVLIPRPETECLVETSLRLLGGEQNAEILDIGTGSGAIALTLKIERPQWRVTATDVSGAALTVARRNARLCGVEVRFRKGSLFFPALQKTPWDLVISNPPYLEFRKDHLSKEVKDWEPSLALEPDASLRVPGLKERAAWCAERILQSCADASVRFTALELSPRVAGLLERRWMKHGRVARVWRESDLAGRKRFLLIAWKNA